MPTGASCRAGEAEAGPRTPDPGAPDGSRARLFLLSLSCSALGFCPSQSKEPSLRAENFINSGRAFSHLLSCLIFHSHPRGLFTEGQWKQGRPRAGSADLAAGLPGTEACTLLRRLGTGQAMPGSRVWVCEERAPEPLVRGRGPPFPRSGHVLSHDCVSRSG